LKQLYVVGANLSTGLSETFSPENPASADMRVISAVRISMSLPLFFAATRWKLVNGKLTSDPHGDVYVDGGLIRNYPLTMFDIKVAKNPKTLGFRLDSKSEIDTYKKDGVWPTPLKINSILDYFPALVKTMSNVQDANFAESGETGRTVFIDTLGVSTTDFKMSEDDKKRLSDSGTKAVRDFFKQVYKKRRERSLSFNSNPIVFGRGYECCGDHITRKRRKKKEKE